MLIPTAINIPRGNLPTGSSKVINIQLTWLRPSTLPRAFPGVPRGAVKSPLVDEVDIGIFMGIDEGVEPGDAAGNTGLNRCC